MKQCVSCGRKCYLGEKYCPACNCYLGNLKEEPEEKFSYNFSTEPIITCPYCTSTNTKKLDFIDRGLSFYILGFASKKIGKQWHCNNCGSDF